MSSSDLWGDALANASPEQVMQMAVAAPKLLSEVSVSDQAYVVRDRGLLLTKKQIIDLRKYEAAGLALPYTLKDVQDYLRFGAGQDGGSGLNINDFLDTFKKTREHTRRWSPLRGRIMMTGQGLKTFASSMLNYGNSIQKILSNDDSVAFLKKNKIRTLAQLKALEIELGDKFPDIEVDPDTVATVGYYLTRIFERIKINLNDVESIKADLLLFDYDLREHVLPDIKLRVGLIESSSLAADVKLLKNGIDDRAKEIDIKNTEYKAAVQEALKSAAGMNIVGLAMAIYMGVEAENIRAARNELYAQQERDIQVLASKNQTLGSLARVKHDLQKLVLVAIDANVATENLLHVWKSLESHVSTSVAAVDQINDAMSLHIFGTEFEEVVLPWKSIETDSDKLIELFKEANDEYERNYSFSARTSRVISLNATVSYPPVNKATLASTIEQMREARTQAEVLKTKLGYLPDLFDRFKHIVIGMGQCQIQLQDSARSGVNDLQNSLRRLARNEKARLTKTDPEVIEEIDVERKGILRSISSAMTKQATLVRGALRDIDERFDMRLTQVYIADFQRDVLVANVEIAQLEGKLAELVADRKVIIEGVALLEKSGIENLGKNVELTIAKITELGLAPPEVQLVMAAIDQMKRTLIGIVESVRFLDMVRESDKLKLKIDGVQADIERERAGISDSQGKVTYLEAIHAMEGCRAEYAATYFAAVNAFERLRGAIDVEVLDDCDALSAALKQHAPLFIEFLTPLSMSQR
ncbi:alpha-xenorhabdolysin family binary toxin subunit A [Pseudomonas fluorescens]|uniref:DNA-binding protein n=1 Tax=Pseudomonas fluorescens TaxID=294 RepID=A0A423L9V3_PSEFL|nr:alpha-xenorhabdolysin family binary toxin subunit A [Pseudomonas fluorescens]RON65082.1 DNA-binding protein [Pseudomonas fluorescens]